MKMAKHSPNGQENTVGKGEIARNEQFLLFPQCFLRPILQTGKNQGLFGKGLSRLAVRETQKNKQLL